MLNNQLIKNNHLSFEELPIAVNARFYYCLELKMGGPNKKAHVSKSMILENIFTFPRPTGKYLPFGVNSILSGKYLQQQGSYWKIFSKNNVIVENIF